MSGVDQNLPSVQALPLASGRTKRHIKPPKRFDDEEDTRWKPGQPQPECVLIRRFLTLKDVTGGLAKRTVCLFWAEDSTWYEATVSKIRVKDRIATVHYSKSEELEDVDLNQMIKAKEICLVESRVKPYQLAAGESWHTEGEEVQEDAGTQIEAHPVETGSGTENQAPQCDDETELITRKGDDEEAVHSDARPSKLQRIGGQSSSAPRETTDVGGARSADRTPETAAQLDSQGQTKRNARLSADSSHAVSNVMSAEEWSRSMLANIVAQATPASETDNPPSNARHPHTDTSEVGPSLVNQSSSAVPSAGIDSVRSKVVSSLTECFTKAVLERAGNGVTESTGRPQEAVIMAEVIESHLHDLYGNAGKDYRAKSRSLLFNLKDPENPGLRSRVLAGDILPADLVRMSAKDLASKELSEWRSKKAAEFEKAVILDAETAAKYSTAAAAQLQENLRKSGKLEVIGFSNTVDSAVELNPYGAETSGVRGGSGREAFEEQEDVTRGRDIPIDGREGSKASSAGEPYSPTHNTTRVNATDSAAKGTTYVSYSARVSPEADVAGQSPPVETTLEVPDDANWDVGDLGTPSKKRSPSFSPSLSDTPYPELDALTGVIQPPSTSVESGSTVWEGRLSVPGLGDFLVGVDQLAGMGDLGYLLPDTAVEVKGRVGNDKLEVFFSDLRSSRSRTVTMGVVRCLSGQVHELMELVHQYSSKNRSGVAEPSEGVEVYFVPRCLLAARFCKTAQQSLPAADRKLVPENVGFGELLCIAVHRKDMVPSSTRQSAHLSKPVLPPEQSPPEEAESDDHEFSPPPDSPPKASSAPVDGGGNRSTDAAAGSPSLLSPLVPAQQTNPVESENAGAVEKPQPPPAVADIDLGNLGALAAAFGVNLSSTQPDNGSSAPAPSNSSLSEPGSAPLPVLPTAQPHLRQAQYSDGFQQSLQIGRLSGPGGQGAPVENELSFQGGYSKAGTYFQPEAMPSGSRPPLPTQQGMAWMNGAGAGGTNNPPPFDPSVAAPQAPSTGLPPLPGGWPAGGSAPTAPGTRHIPSAAPHGPMGFPQAAPTWPAPPHMGPPHLSAEVPHQTLPHGGYLHGPSPTQRRNFDGPAHRGGTGGRQRQRNGWGWGRGHPYK